MSEKRTSAADTSNDEQTNEGSDSVSQPDGKSKRAKLTTSSDTAISTARGENGWQSEKTTAESMLYMLDNEIATDVCIEVGPPDGETATFRAHKCILIMRSAVFEGMFCSGMSECRSGPEAKVRIEDIDADIFKEVLNYMYCERASISPESAAYLMYAAKKYMLSKLVGECCKCLLKNLDVNNVVQFLDHSLHLDEQQLQDACLKLISVNAKVVLTGAEILSASRLVIEAILAADTLRVREPIVYETAIKWAKHQLQMDKTAENPSDLQIREKLGEMLYKIRFPVMTPTEFSEISLYSDILTSEDKELVFHYLVTEKKHQNLRFPTEWRFSEELSVIRAVYNCSGRWHSAPCADVIDVVVDQDILLTGVGLYTGYNGNGYMVDIEVSQSTNSLMKKTFTVPYSGDSNAFKCSFGGSILMPAGVLYTIRSYSYGMIGSYGNKCKQVCTEDCVTFTFSTHPETRYTTQDCGQIPVLYFCVL